MRTLSAYQAAALAFTLFGGTASVAQTAEGLNAPILIPSQSSVFNQNSMNLPAAPSVSGQDIVRGADGTTCQSAVASGGPYVDVGVLQSQDFFDRESAALYGRVVFPIGRRAKRVDCTALYKLEIERMRMELEVLRMGSALGDSLGWPQAGLAASASSSPAPAALLAPAARPAPAPAADEPSPPRGLVVGPPTDEPQPIRPQAGTASARVPAPLGPKDDPVVAAVGPLAPGFYAQTGAFSDAEKAAARLREAANDAGRDDGSLRLLKRGQTTLFRTLFGPMPKDEAEALCHFLPGDCFVSGS